MRYKASVVTDVGNVKDTNEDSSYLQIVKDESVKIFALVADGMGGLDSGEVASQHVRDVFKKWFCDNHKDLSAKSFPEIKQMWTTLAEEENETIKAHATENGKKMGTTLVVLFICENAFLVMNIGDSRCYIHRPGDLTQITKDQTVAQRDIDDGVITEEEAKDSKGSHVLLQCIGASPKVVPDFHTGKIKKDEEVTFFLCSDGLRNKIEPEEFLEEFETDSATKLKLKNLIDKVKKREERDNLTGILISRK